MHSGSIKVGQQVHALKSGDNEVVESMKLFKIFKRRGMNQIEIDAAFAGDIVSVAGFNKATVCTTLVLSLRRLTRHSVNRSTSLLPILRSRRRCRYF